MKRWRDIRIGKKIMIAVGIVVLALVCVSVIVVRGITSIVRDGLEVSSGNKLRGELLQREVDHLKWTQELGRYVYGGGDLKVQLDPRQCGFGKWYYGEGRKQAETLLPALHESLQAIEKPHTSLHESAAHIKGLFDQGRIGDTHEYYEATTLSHLGAVQGLLKKMAEISKENILSEEGMLEHAIETRMSTITISVVAILCGMVLGWAVTRTIERPVQKSLEFAEKVASGDFRSNLDIPQQDEMGKLAGAMNSMVNKLKQVITDVQYAADNVASGSRQLSSGAEQLSQGTTEQASSTEEASSSVQHPMRFRRGSC